MKKSTLNVRLHGNEINTVVGEVFEVNGIKFFTHKTRYWNVFDYKTGFRLLSDNGTKVQAKELMKNMLSGKSKDQVLSKLEDAWNNYPSLN